MRILNLIILLTIFFACNKSNHSNKISEKKMQSIIKDMVAADVFVGNYLVKDSTQYIKRELVKYYDTIFAIHKVSKKQFEESLNQYMQDPNQFKIMLDSIQVNARKVNALDVKLNVN